MYLRQIILQLEEKAIPVSYTHLDSLASVSSSQDVHICCMTSSIDPVLLPIAIQLEYIFEKRCV